MKTIAVILALNLSFLVAGCKKTKNLPNRPAEAPFAQRQNHLLYQRSCIGCHGEKGKGDGLDWPDHMQPKPANLHQTTPAQKQTWLEGKSNSCPQWIKVYSPVQIKSLTLVPR